MENEVILVGMVIRTTSKDGRILVGGMITTFRYNRDDGRSVVKNPKDNKPMFKACEIGGKPLKIKAPKLGDKIRFETVGNSQTVSQWAYECEWMRVKHGQANVGIAPQTRHSKPRKRIDWSTALEQAGQYAIAREEERMERFVGPPKPPVTTEEVDENNVFTEAIEAGAQALPEPDVRDDDDIVAWVSEYLRPRADVAANIDELVVLAAEYIAG